MSASLLFCLGFLLVVTTSASTIQPKTSNRHDELHHSQDESIRKYLEKINSTTLYYNNTMTFTCQHGDAECYGNKLHACAEMYHQAKQLTNFVMFNACLMDFNRSKSGSDDDAVKECQSILNIDEQVAKKIPGCAKSNLGNALLDIMGKNSRIAKYTTLPHVKINNIPWTGKPENLIKEVCAYFKNPPEPCKNVK